MPSTPASAELRQRQIADEIAGLGLCLPGSLVERTTRCGSPRCRCHTDPSYLHGPYPSWIRKVGRVWLFWSELQGLVWRGWV
jgi:hypothetical protein